VEYECVRKLAASGNLRVVVYDTGDTPSSLRSRTKSFADQLSIFEIGGGIVPAKKAVSKNEKRFSRPLYLVNASRRKTRKKLIYDVMHDLVAVRWNGVR
jgi:hypothetical protein